MPRGERRRRIRRRVAIAVLVLGIVALAAAAACFIGVLQLAPDLRAGRSALEAGQASLLAGKTDDAAASFREALNRFRAAQDGSRSVFTAASARAPVIGRTIDVISALAESGVRVSEAGVRIATAVHGLPRGIDGFLTRDGGVSLNGSRLMADALAAAGGDVAAASRALHASPNGFLPSPLARARALAIDRVDRFGETIRSGAALARALPIFAGGEQPKRYLFFAENPAELRGTGGLWGAFSIVEADAGRFAFSRFRPVQILPTLPTAAVEAPNEDYARNYGQYGAPGYWLNTNMTPDMPSAARAALAMWRASGRPSLDGVITADPFALQELLEVTGPVGVADLGIVVTAGDVVELLSNRAFSIFDDSERRKAVLGEAARAVLGRFLAIEGRTVPRLRALAEAVAGGHLKLYSTDLHVRSALRVSGADARLGTTGPSDLLAVIVNSSAGGKVDYFARRTIRHEIELLPGERVTTATRITLENHAPTSGQPRYVIGPHIAGARAGDSIPLVALFCGPDCRLATAERDGHPVSLKTGRELGYRLFRDYFTIPAGRTRSLSITTQVSDGWRDQGSAGSYRLTLVGQTTIRPTETVLRVQAPAGMYFSSSSGGVRVMNDVASWRGEVSGRREFTLTLERSPLLIRAWRALFGP